VGLRTEEALIEEGETQGEDKEGVQYRDELERGGNCLIRAENALKPTLWSLA
jgi:hypothetical protein